MADAFTGYPVDHHVGNAFGVIGNPLKVFGNLNSNGGTMGVMLILYHEG